MLLTLRLQKVIALFNHFVSRFTALGRKLTTQLSGATRIIFRYSPISQFSICFFFIDGAHICQKHV